MKKLVLVAMVAVIALATLPASAALFTVYLANGTSIDTRYQPQRASWDEQTVLVLTDQGNWIGLAEQDIQKIAEQRVPTGYARRLDARTVEIGYTANDSSGEENGEAGDGQGAGVDGTGQYDAAPWATGYFGPAEPVQFVDPSSLGIGGIPLSYGSYGDPVQ